MNTANRLDRALDLFVKLATRELSEKDERMEYLKDEIHPFLYRIFEKLSDIEKSKLKEFYSQGELNINSIMYCLSNKNIKNSIHKLFNAVDEDLREPTERFVVDIFNYFCRSQLISTEL